VPLVRRSVAAVTDDLLLGTNVAGWLRAGGFDARLHAPGAELPEHTEAVVIDLASSGFDGIGLAVPAGAKRVGIYSHVDADTRQEALDAGFDLVVPRSRFAREGAKLVERLLGP
jgi:hypothetical protein